MANLKGVGICESEFENLSYLRTTLPEKLTFSHLKTDGWMKCIFFGWPIFQVFLLLVSGRIHNSLNEFSNGHHVRDLLLKGGFSVREMLHIFCGTPGGNMIIQMLYHQYTMNI